VQIDSIIITRRNFDKFRRQYGWKGQGTKEDPVILDKDSSIAPRLIFNVKKYHFHLRTLNLKCIDLKYSRNILIENCTLHTLYLSNCKNVIVRGSTINQLVTEFRWKKATLESNTIENHQKNTFHIYLLFILLPSAILCFLLFYFINFNLFFAVVGVILIFILIIYCEILSEQQRYCLRKGR